MVGLSAVLASCGADGGSDVWWLVDATPDGQVLELATLGGGLRRVRRLGQRELSGRRHEDCLALPAEGDEHRTFPARIEAGGPGAVVVGLEDVWGVEFDGTIAWRRPLDGSPESLFGELDVRDDPLAGSEAVDPGSGHAARLAFDGEGSWLEVLETATGELRHRIRVRPTPRRPSALRSGSTTAGSCSGNSNLSGSGSWI